MNTVTKLTQIFTVTLILGSTLNSCTSGETRQEKVLMRERPDCTQANVNYAGNRSPLRPMNFIKLPVRHTTGRMVKKVPESAKRGIDRTFGRNQRMACQRQ